MSPALETDVCVLGGGPAGASFALRLATLGYRVCVIEREAFPRAHVGESLTPGIWPLLDALGLGEAMARAGFLPSTEALVRWSEAAALRVRARASEPGLLVDRGRFDQLLLEAAAGAGAQVLQPATALGPERVSGGWEVPVSRGGEHLRVRARFVADASGRAFVLGGKKTPTAARTLALYAYWRHDRLRGVETRVEASPDGWLWGAPLPDGTFNAMAFMDPEALRSRGVRKQDLEGFYRERLGQSELLAGCADAARVSPVFARDATCYADPEPVGDDFIKLGEAGFSIDPLSSAGVQKALQTALSGGAVAHTLLSRPENAEAARRFYVENQRASVEQHGAWAAGYYHEHRQFADRPFWTRRARPPPEPPPPAAPLGPGGELLGRRVRLSRETAVVDTPCLVGDGVELRRALTHPRLARPVAYLGEVELAPLLEGLSEGVLLGRLVHGWALRMPAETGLSIAGWLLRNGLLIPA